MIPIADAQVVLIQTSADTHGSAFFGEGALQIVVTDENADDDDVQEDITVDIDAHPDVGASASGSFTIPETSESSGRFEFFVMHADATSVSSSDLDTINVNGAKEYDGSLGEAPIIRFGSGEELAIASSLFEPVTFDITVGDSEITVDYEESSALLELDRSTYGSDSLVYVIIVDQDANKNPTETDNFIVTQVDTNTILFDVTGASFNEDVLFEETGDNTAQFEAVLELGVGLVASAEAVELTLNDRSDYEAPSFNPPNDSTDTSSRSFDIDDEDGELDEVTTLTFGSELKVTLNDNDRNRDSGDEETLDGPVSVRVEDGDLNHDGILDAGEADEEILDMEETDDNTGIFVIDLSNNELPITFLADGESPTIGNSILELRADEITANILIEYNDTSDDDSNISITSSQTVELTLAIGSINLPDSTAISDDFLVTLTDADMNDNPRTKDSYYISLYGSGDFPLARGGDSIGDLATLEVEIEGDPVSFAVEIVATLVETDINSGIFTTELATQEVLDSTGVVVDDGDILRIIYIDHMDETTRESADDMAIGKRDVPPGDFVCMGREATIVGTEGADLLNGTEGPDVIVGLRGNDIINGLGGDDVICGELGLDNLSGGDGNDMLFGGNANDILSGDAGGDRLWGGTGWDQLAGGFGNDVLRGGIGNDRLAGGEGDDLIYGQEGLDQLEGGTGHNLIFQD